MEAETKPAKYLSRYLSLRIVRKSAQTREVNGQAITTPGESIRFAQGLYETSDAGEQEFIESREEFKKGLIIRVPDNVQDLLANRKEWMKDMETKELEAELAKRKKAEGEAKAGIKGSAEGSQAGKGNSSDDGLEAMKMPELVKLGKAEGLDEETLKKFSKPGAKKVELVELLRKNRTEKGNSNGPAY